MSVRSSGYRVALLGDTEELRASLQQRVPVRSFRDENAAVEWLNAAG